MTINCSAQLASIFSWVKHPPPPLMRVNWWSASSAPSIATFNWRKRQSCSLIKSLSRLPYLWMHLQVPKPQPVLNNELLCLEWWRHTNDVQPIIFHPLSQALDGVHNRRPAANSDNSILFKKNAFKRKASRQCQGVTGKMRSIWFITTTWLSTAL